MHRFLVVGSEGNSLTTSTANERGQHPSSSTTKVGGNSENRGYINIDELLHDMAVNDGVEDGDEQGDLICWVPKVQRFLKILLTIWTKMIFYLGI